MTAERAFRQTHPIEEASSTTPHPPSEYLPHNQYDWESTAPECRLSPFNRTRACLALSKAAGGDGRGKQGRILFVGDSMSYTHALSLLFMLGPDDGNAGRWVPKQTEWKEAAVCGDELGGEDRAVLLHFIRNDGLYVAREKVAGWGQQRRQDLAAVAHDGLNFTSSRPWTPYFEEHLPGAVVLNMGLHVHGLAYYKALLDDTLGYLQRHRAQWQHQEKQATSGNAYPRLLFRTTAPGHPECWRYAGPVSEEEARQLGEYEGKYRSRFTWHLIPEFNGYLERRISEVLGQGEEEEVEEEEGALLLRADQITRRRPDGHLSAADCLHYHLPGPPDAWTLTFLETLYALHGV